MTLKDTCKNMKTLLEAIASDLEKADRGNKAASQRVRTGTIRLEKIAKGYRKESIKEEKKGGGSKKKAKPAAVKKAGKKAAPAKSAAKPKKVTKAKTASKKPTAKMPKKR